MNEKRERIRPQYWGQWLFLALIAFGCEDGFAARGVDRIWMPAKITVDSCGYEYDSAPLCDGIREPLRWRESWASRETCSEPHWVELVFTSPVPVKAVAIHWNIERGQPKSSQSYAIQVWQNGAFTNILEIRDNPPAPRTVHVFGGVTTDRLRVWQPPGGGPATRSNVMWIAEIEVYNYPKKEAEFGKQPDLEQVKLVQAAVRDRTIGIYRRGRHQGRSGAIEAPLAKQGWRIMELDRLDERELKLCRIVVIAGTRHIPHRDTLLAFLHNGGGVLFVHDACGRSVGSLLPNLWEFTGMGEGEFLTVDPNHPITYGLPMRFFPTYGDHVCLKAGGAGKVLVRDVEGHDVVVAGRVGEGKAVAIGSFPGLSSGTNWDQFRVVSPGVGELALLTNSIFWLARDTKLKECWKDGLAWWPWRRRHTEAKPLFTDVTESCGMTYAGYSKGVAMADVNEDGQLDIFVTVDKVPTADPYHNLLYRNDGNWVFTETASEAGVTEPPGIGCVFGDVNGDGHLDLFVCWIPEMGGQGRGTLYLGDGKGHFRDVTVAAGLGNIGMTAVCMMADVNNDDHLDLYLVGPESENKLFINRGDGTFEDKTAAFGLAGLGNQGGRGYGNNLATAMADLDNDGFTDLVCFSGGALRVFRNQGGKGFKEVIDYMGPGKAPIAGGPLGLTLGDVDNDGDLDLYIAGVNILLRNEGGMRFANITAGAGLNQLERNMHPYCPIFADWDNDGWLDLFLGSGGFDSFAFRNNGDGTFSDVTATIGLDVFGVHGCNFGDLDGDGDLDFYATSWAKHPFTLLRNNCNNGNALTIRIKGHRTNTSGVGAKVWVYEEGGTNRQPRLRGYREVRSGGGSMYSGAILEQHIGVPHGGSYTVEVLFPVSGKRVKVSGVSAPRTLMIEEP